MGVEPTRQQLTLAAALARYCSPETPQDSVFILNGYAGTGKTTVIGALVKALPDVGLKAVLLAPTGRAAKVLAAHAAHSASTIHRRIYRHAAPGSPGSAAGLYRIGIAENRSSNTVFIVDEASMIADDPEGSLLTDLLHYVFTGTNCRLILSGDTAQLPPPGSDFSPAMASETFRRIGLHVMRATMTATVRQAATSGILYNATLLRRNLQETPIPLPRLRQRPFADVSAITSEDLLDALSSAYSEHGTIGTLLITRSNSRAVKFNLAIRSQILDYETELAPGEPLMIAKNNYYWTRQVKGMDFIANGDTAIVERIYGTEMRGDVTFADVALRFPDHDITIDTKILLSSLYCEAPALTPRVADDLLHAVTDYPPGSVNPGPVPVVDLRNDTYYNALQVKYAYAVTCHKAQGGQWQSVFVDMAALQPDALTSLDFYRWLYTATTRAVDRLTYISPPEQIID
ncbi:MAG: AAA family ATPase [Muribaculaceae bacterium]|nr:AAA family ATPase [Muribaculaceae bacterium]